MDGNVGKMRFNFSLTKGIEVDINEYNGQVVLYNRATSLAIPVEEWMIIEKNLRNNLPAFLLRNYRRKLQRNKPIIISDTWYVRMEFTIPEAHQRRALVIYEKFPWLPDLDLRFSEIILTRLDAKKILDILPAIRDHIQRSSEQNTPVRLSAVTGGDAIPSLNLLDHNIEHISVQNTYSESSLSTLTRRTSCDISHNEGQQQEAILQKS